MCSVKWPCRSGEIVAIGSSMKTSMRPSDARADRAASSPPAISKNSRLRTWLPPYRAADYIVSVKCELGDTGGNFSGPWRAGAGLLQESARPAQTRTQLVIERIVERQQFAQRRV